MGERVGVDISRDQLQLLELRRGVDFDTFSPRAERQVALAKLAGDIVRTGDAARHRGVAVVADRALEEEAGITLLTTLVFMADEAALEAGAPFATLGRGVEIEALGAAQADRGDQAEGAALEEVRAELAGRADKDVSVAARGADRGAGAGLAEAHGLTAGLAARSCRQKVVAFVTGGAD